MSARGISLIGAPLDLGAGRRGVDMGPSALRQAGLHVSFDLDGVDPEHAPGVGTPSPGGISYREAHLAMEMLADTGKVLSAEFVEVNPVLDDRNRTAKLGVGLLASLLGKKIL